MHFLLLGAALFVLDALRPAGPAGTSEIGVSAARVRNLAQNFTRTWQRPPTREELAGLIESYVREEVMVREALALGFDRDDAIVRRRLQQKMQFVSEEATALAKPTDEELNAYLKAHADTFRSEPRATFSQVYLDPHKRQATLATDAKRLLDTLNRAEGSVGPANAGDRLLLVEPRYEDASQAEVARIFGAEFAEALMKQPVGKWGGPIPSGYGVHLVRLETLTPGGARTLDDTRPLVEREWANAKREALGQALYEKLRAKYTIRVQMPEPARP